MIEQARLAPLGLLPAAIMTVQLHAILEWGLQEPLDQQYALAERWTAVSGGLGVLATVSIFQFFSQATLERSTQGPVSRMSRKVYALGEL